MNDLLNDPKALVGYLLTALMGLAMYIWRKSDADKDRRIENLERNAVTKAYVDERHNENTGRFENLGRRFDKLEDVVTEAVTRTHSRIDDLYRDLIEK